MACYLMLYLMLCFFLSCFMFGLKSLPLRFGSLLSEASLLSLGGFFGDTSLLSLGSFFGESSLLSKFGF